MEGIRGSSSTATDMAAADRVLPCPSSADLSADPVVEGAEEFLAWLGMTGGSGVEDATRIDRIAALERVKGALAAAQVRQTVAFAASQRAGMPAWTPERTAARSIGSQVALARGESPTRGDAHVALAQALTQSLPQTLAALTKGRISEAGAESVHRALEGMDPALKREVDDRLAPELGTLGERSLGEAARRVANAVDDDAASRRVERAALSRRVTLRTAKDGMAYLTVLAPMAEAAGAFQAVEAEATALLGQPGHAGTPSGRSAFWLADPDTPAGPEVSADPAAEPRQGLPHSGLSFFRPRPVGSKSQLMADVVIARLTGRAIGQPVPIEIQLVITDQALTNTTNHDATAHAAPAGPRSPAPTFTARTGSPVRAPARREQRGQSSGHPAFSSTTPEHKASDTASPPAGGTPAAEHGPPGPANAPPAGRAGPAKIVGAGWLPAGFARELVRRTIEAGSEVTVRRVLLEPDGTTVAGLEARRHRLTDPVRSTTPPVLAPTTSTHRLFRGILRRLIMVRDQTCRTPFCAAAIRAADHITPARRDGPTRAHNAQGTCDRCNLTKEAPGWNVVVTSPPPPPPPRNGPSLPRWQQLMDDLLADEQHPAADSDHGHRTAVITPTGHVYQSTAPAVTERRHPGSAAR